MQHLSNWLVKKYKVPLDPPIFFTLFYLWHIFVGGAFNPIPKNEELKILHGEIVRARSATPEFIVQLAGGEKVEMQWAAPYLLLDRSTSNGPYLGENKKLLGCQVEIHYDSMRFTLMEHLRIWELNCQNKAIKVSKDAVIERFKENMHALNFGFACVLTFIYILSFIFFLREKRGHL